ncbi:TadE/TadG family type IV pilus assembly protein [Parerythrobacter aestuarii]|uniref:TadE/TadG family type IV pilus assembly protein n=1 Tax=Parerythrobacter aestuarii TaxID=3020909 RepID=UPI0024DE42DE|nr:TadE/TadG family type IV pilus assembly protein [Parerythrobacter aestuarii]
MLRRFSNRALAKDTRGSSTVDFAFALPILAVIMIATLQAGQVLHARGSLRHAVGEGVRLAKVNPSATQTEVITLVKAELPSLKANRLSNLTFTRGTQNGADIATVTASYTTEANYPIISFPVTITETKTVYLPS